jgi:hypothetical protein
MPFYCQLVLYINGGPTGHGNRLKLPTCVLTGIQKLFPDPHEKYTDHHKLECMKTDVYNGTTARRAYQVITFITIYSTSYVNSMSHHALALYFWGNLECDIQNKSNPRVKY